MKTADLYAGLNWKTVEFLIPRQNISDASLCEATDRTTVPIDDAVCNAFHGSLCRPTGPEGFQSVLVIGGRRYGTGIMPQTVTLEADRLSPPCRILRETFARHGLLSISFGDGTIRYVVDMAKFTARED